MRNEILQLLGWVLFIIDLQAFEEAFDRRQLVLGI